jgi:cell shape-determining protein MreD
MVPAVIYGLAIVIIGVAQTSIAPRLALRGVEPEFALVLVACIGLARGPAAGCAAGFLSAVIVGSLEGQGLGGLLLRDMVAGLVCGAFRGQLFAERVPVAVGFALAVVFVAGALSAIFGGGVGFTTWLSAASIKAVYSAVCAIPIFAFVRGVSRRFPRRSDA